jgi:predicted dehydrogenase
MTTGSTRWALIGTGGMALNIIEDFHLTENVVLTTVVSRSPEKAAAFAAEWGIPSFVSDYEDALTSSEVDVVYIATPHPSHFDLAERAIAAGKHVLVEKPMTMTAADAEELGDLARGAGVFLMEAMWTRFNPVIRKAQELVAAGQIGIPRAAQATFGAAFPFDPDNRLWNPELGGGTVLDQGVYLLTWAHIFFGPPSSVTARGAVTEAGVDSEATILLGYANGEQVTLGSSMTAFLPMTASVGGPSGQIIVDAPFWASDGYTVASFSREHFDVPIEGRGYLPMLRAVSQAILDGMTEHPLCLVADTVAVLHTVDEVLRQIKVGSMK